MTINETRKLLHKALQFAPDHGVFPLIGCVADAMKDEHDQDKIAQAFTPVRELFIENYGFPDSSGHPQFFELNDSGRRFKAEKLS